MINLSRKSFSLLRRKGDLRIKKNRVDRSPPAHCASPDRYPCNKILFSKYSYDTCDRFFGAFLLVHLTNKDPTQRNSCTQHTKQQSMTPRAAVWSRNNPNEIGLEIILYANTVNGIIHGPLFVLRFPLDLIRQIRKNRTYVALPVPRASRYRKLLSASQKLLNYFVLLLLLLLIFL